MNDMNAIAEAILQLNSYCILATGCEDGAPWAVPVHFAYDSTYVYWLSQDSTIHSQNIARDGRVFIVVFDSRQASQIPGEKGAVYISTQAIKLSGEAAMAARNVYTGRYPDENIRKLAEWSVYAAPIGIVNETKSIDRMIYFHNNQGTTSS